MHIVPELHFHSTQSFRILGQRDRNVIPGVELGNLAVILFTALRRFCNLDIRHFHFAVFQERQHLRRREIFQRIRQVLGLVDTELVGQRQITVSNLAQANGILQRQIDIQAVTLAGGNFVFVNQHIVFRHFRIGGFFFQRRDRIGQRFRRCIDRRLIGILGNRFRRFQRGVQRLQRVGSVGFAIRQFGFGRCHSFVQRGAIHRYHQLRGVDDAQIFHFRIERLIAVAVVVKNQHPLDVHGIQIIGFHRDLLAFVIQRFHIAIEVAQFEVEMIPSIFLGNLAIAPSVVVILRRHIINQRRETDLTVFDQCRIGFAAIHHIKAQLQIFRFHIRGDVVGFVRRPREHIGSSLSLCIVDFHSIQTGKVHYNAVFVAFAIEGGIHDAGIFDCHFQFKRIVILAVAIDVHFPGIVVHLPHNIGQLRRFGVFHERRLVVIGVLVIPRNNISDRFASRIAIAGSKVGQIRLTRHLCNHFVVRAVDMQHLVAGFIQRTVTGFAVATSIGNIHHQRQIIGVPTSQINGFLRGHPHIAHRHLVRIGLGIAAGVFLYLRGTFHFRALRLEPAYHIVGLVRIRIGISGCSFRRSGKRQCQRRQHQQCAHDGSQYAFAFLHSYRPFSFIEYA